MKQTITIRIPDDLRLQLEEISEAEKKPINDIVSECLRKYIILNRFRKLRDRVLPFAEAEGLLTDEEIFDITL